MKISLPLLDSLVQIEEKVRKQFPEKGSCWPEAIDLSYLHKSADLKNGGYYCTPINSLAFAWPGVDGEHFSFLIQNGQSNEEFPVIFTAPCHYDGDVNVIVAKNLRTFSRLALQHGCFNLSELAYDNAKAVRLLISNQNCTEQDPDREHQATYQKIRSFVAKDLDLPSYSFEKKEFTALQQQYIPLLQISEDLHS